MLLNLSPGTMGQFEPDFYNLCLVFEFLRIPILLTKLILSKTNFSDNWKKKSKVQDTIFQLGLGRSRLFNNKS